MAAPNDTNRLTFTYDSNLLFKDAYLVAATAAAKVNGSPKLIDVGDGDFRGWMVIDWTACEVDSSNELYTITVQGCSRDTTSTRDIPVVGSTIENLTQLDLGHTSVRKGGAATSPATGRVLIPFRNVVLGTTLPIIRVYTTVAGTVATGINYTAWAGKMVY
jgi:hypothetical protein